MSDQNLFTYIAHISSEGNGPLTIPTALATTKFRKDFSAVDTPLQEAMGLIGEEERAQGVVKGRVLSFYCTAVGRTLETAGIPDMEILLIGARVMGQY